MKPNRQDEKKRKEDILFQNSSKKLFFKYSSHICKIFPIHRIKRMMEIQKSQSCFEIPPHESTSSPLDTPLRLSLHKSPALGAIFGPFPRRSEWKHLSLCLETKREREVRYACFESTGVSPSSRSLVSLLDCLSPRLYHLFFSVAASRRLSSPDNVIHSALLAVNQPVTFPRKSFQPRNFLDTARFPRFL